MAERKTTPSKAKASAPRKRAAPKKKTGSTATAKKQPDHGSQDDSLYSNPDLRARLKHEIQAADKGGRAGQWSARKSQLLAHEYEAQGGGYTKAEHAPKQRDLKHWTEEKWTTADGTKAVQGEETARYLPGKAWDKLTPAQKRATDAKKRAASKRGEQFVANPPPAKAARKKSAKKD